MRPAPPYRITAQPFSIGALEQIPNLLLPCVLSRLSGAGKRWGGNVPQRKTRNTKKSPIFCAPCVLSRLSGADNQPRRSGKCDHPAVITLRVCGKSERSPVITLRHSENSECRNGALCPLSQNHETPNTHPIMIRISRPQSNFATRISAPPCLRVLFHADSQEIRKGCKRVFPTFQPS